MLQRHVSCRRRSMPVLMIGLVGAEPDLGTAMVLFSCLSTCCFHAGSRLASGELAIPVGSGWLGMLLFVALAIGRGP